MSSPLAAIMTNRHDEMDWWGTWSTLLRGNADLRDYYVVPICQVDDNVLEAPLVASDPLLTNQQIVCECNENVCSNIYFKGDPVDLLQRSMRPQALLERTTADTLSFRSPQPVDMRGLPTNFYELRYSLLGWYSCVGLEKTWDKMIAQSGIAPEIA